MGRSSLCRTLLFAAAGLAPAAPAMAVEYGLSNYQLGLVLPLAGYTPPPGVYFWDSFYLYNGSGNLYQNGSTRNPSNVNYNIAANIGIIAWFTDWTLFGGELGFANTSAYGSETTTVTTPYVDAFGVDRHVTTQQGVAAFADTEFSAVLGWHAGDQHWSVTLSGFVPTGNYDAARIAQTGLNRPSVDLKGAYTFLSLANRARSDRRARRQRQLHQHCDELPKRRRTPYRMDARAAPALWACRRGRRLFLPTADQ